MVQEILTLLPGTLTTDQAVVCLLCLLAGVFFWLSGSIWSRGIITLFAVAIGALLGMYVPRWQLWPVNSMAAAVLGAVGFGLIAFLIERLWMGLTFGLVLVCWATLGTWIQQRPANFIFPQRVAWQIENLTPPQRAYDIYMRLPIEVQNVLPYAAGTALLSGLAIAFLWPRLGRALGMSILGITMCVVFGLALVATQQPGWLQYIPAPPMTQAGMLVGLAMVGLLAQWPFLAARTRHHDDTPSSALAAPAQPPPTETAGRDLARILT
jgi:hypothetical protein